MTTVWKSIRNGIAPVIPLPLIIRFLQPQKPGWGWVLPCLSFFWLALVVFSLTALLGIVAFMQVEGGGTPIWLLFAIENYMLVIGVSVAASFCVVGYVFRVRRMYAYALLTLVMFVTGHFLHYALHYYLTLLGTLILLFGLALLIRFIRRYPRSTKGSMGDSGYEGQ